tara:strand:+ start:509 stop:1075 length:567 start_codon:yes stop_codon:yes gene_type:complete
MTRIEVGLGAGVSGDYEVAIYTDETTDKQWQIYLNWPKMEEDEYDSWTVLLKEGCPMPIMQNTHAEYVEHQWLWDNATGDVLIGGLGIGFVHKKLIDNPNVTSVTIVEISQDVVDLVWDSCEKDDTFSLVLDDFETYTPPAGTSFDTVWCDTWIHDNPMTLQEYKETMATKYSEYTDNIGFWGDGTIV